MGWEPSRLLKITCGNGSSESGPGPGWVPVGADTRGKASHIVHLGNCSSPPAAWSNQDYAASCSLSRQKPSENLKHAAAGKKGKGMHLKGRERCQ